ncbi:GNAT family N-acetyltransferase [Maribacter sp. HTCC2170]|uniref:GNAT family N-acetyltransferase n=1 Tax=Maribacter sp. (strain HTCC2170 / KCCM 42371) TaxID=313603 RepID=UPI00006AFDB2|nr:GNAT family N-acetyltransferase [Maribacter sp. HTCC2170]EAR01394.1 probable acetyltransferase [Maribacter sp. HTCC2170]
MIREYKNSDLEDVMTIWYDAQTKAHPFLSQNFVQMVKMMMRDMFIPNSKTWVFEDTDTVLGFIAMMDNEIGGLFVDPNAQSKGIGTSLLKYVESFHKMLEVEVFDQNKIGKPFYIKHGFKTMRQYMHAESNQKVIRMQRLTVEPNTAE